VNIICFGQLTTSLERSERSNNRDDARFVRYRIIATLDSGCVSFDVTTQTLAGPQIIAPGSADQHNSEALKGRLRLIQAGGHRRVLMCTLVVRISGTLTTGEWRQSYPIGTFYRATTAYAQNKKSQAQPLQTAGLSCFLNDGLTG